MNIDDLIQKTISDYCNEKGYDKELTTKLSQIVNRYRKGSVEVSDLGIFLKQLEDLVKDK